MIRTGAKLFLWIRSHRKWPAGYCLQYTRTAFNVGAKYPDASTGWRNAKYKHTSYPPPRGVPVWWTGGSKGHGHVAVSAGKGKCWSTDAKGATNVAKVDIRELTRRWGLRYEGWSEDINGVRVYDANRGKPAKGWENVRLSALGPGKNNNDVWVVKRRLAKKVGKGGMHLTGKYKKYWGEATTKAYARWQRQLGFRGTAADGLPGRQSLEALNLNVID